MHSRAGDCDAYFGVHIRGAVSSTERAVTSIVIMQKVCSTQPHVALKSVHHCSPQLNLFNQFFQHEHRIRNKRGAKLHSHV